MNKHRPHQNRKERGAKAFWTEPSSQESMCNEDEETMRRLVFNLEGKYHWALTGKIADGQREYAKSTAHEVPADG